MARTGDFILVYFLDDEPVGKTWERSRNHWPLHITLVPWFGLRHNTRVVPLLEECAKRHAAFNVTVADVEHFNESTTVSLLQDQTDIHLLHTDLIEVVQELGAQLASTPWIKEGYTAHVTHHGGMRVPIKDEVLQLRKFSLVALEPFNRCRIVQHFNLKDNV
jgi:2'-5' RNA ligase